MQIFKIPYYVRNNGDGSASVEFFQKKEDAKKADESQSEGWGEPSVGELRLTLIDGELYFEKYSFEERKFVKLKL